MTLLKLRGVSEKPTPFWLCLYTAVLMTHYGFAIAEMHRFVQIYNSLILIGNRAIVALP